MDVGLLNSLTENELDNLTKFNTAQNSRSPFQDTDKVPFIEITYSVSHFIKIPLKGEVGGAKQVEGQQEGFPRRQGEGGD